MSLQLERSKQLEYNLAVLKRRDADISKVLDMAGHVVLYQFNEDSKVWDRKNVEGSLFVVERSSAPQFQFVVLNRLSSENLVETIDDNFQTELTEQFLLYRNLQEEILGVWFYSPPERAAIAELLDTIHATGSAPADTGGGAVDVTEAVEPPAASSVANFFAMAGAAEGAAKPPPMPTNAVVSAEEEPTPPADAPVTSSVANFFSMAASAEPPPAKPPAPAPAPAPPPAVPQAAAPTAPPTSGAMTSTPPAADLAALKTKLAGQLKALLDDDAFLTLLATEYHRQTQRAMAQVCASRDDDAQRSLLFLALLSASYTPLLLPLSVRSMPPRRPRRREARRGARQHRPCLLSALRDRELVL
jgi:hypothetical protein